MITLLAGTGFWLVQSDEPLEATGSATPRSTTTRETITTASFPVAEVVVASDAPLPLLPSSDQEPAIDDPAIGRPAPAVTGVDSAGSEIRFGEGAGTALVIFDSIDNTDMVSIAVVAALLDDSGRINSVPVILVVTGDAEDAAAWIDDSNWPGAAVVDPSGSVLLHAYGVDVVPHYVAIGADGTVAGRASGPLSAGATTLLALSAISGSPVVAETTTTTSSTPPSTTVTTTTPGVVRTATLFSSFAKLREAPDIQAAEITTLISRNGEAIEILSTHEAGWYRVRFDGLEGWIFGTFILPPDPGFNVAQTRSGETAVLLNVGGDELQQQNESGPKVLVTDATGTLWQVLLPDGGTAWVDAATMVIVQ